MARPARWTTGQGIGFLVALPGWILLGLSMPVALVGLVVSDSTDAGPRDLRRRYGQRRVRHDRRHPRHIVFNKCKRR